MKSKHDTIIREVTLDHIGTVKSELLRHAEILRQRAADHQKFAAALDGASPFLVCEFRHKLEEFGRYVDQMDLESSYALFDIDDENVDELLFHIIRGTRRRRPR